jgi:hypothetical protein
MSVLVQLIGADFWGNQALGDRSMKLGMQLGLDLGKIFDLGTSQICPVTKNSGYFRRGCDHNMLLW